MRLFFRLSSLRCLMLAATGVLGGWQTSTAALFQEGEARGQLIAQPEDGEHDIDECSGLVASRQSPGLLWTNDDSFKTAVFVLCFDDHAHFVRRYKVLNNPHGDFEEMTIGIGPEPGVTYLYLGDIGNNAAQIPADIPRKNKPRTDIKLHRFREPTGVIPGEDVDLTEQVTTIHLAYPDGQPHNAETMMMDPEGNLYIVVKEPNGHVFGIKRETLAAYKSGVITMDLVATIQPQYVLTNMHMGSKRRKAPDGRVYGMTGGSISADGSMILIKNMWESFLWFTLDAPTKENPWSRWAATLSPHGPTVQEPREKLTRVPPLAPDTEEPSQVGRGETIAFTPDGNGYFTAAEGKHTTLYYFAATTPSPDAVEAKLMVDGRVLLAWHDRGTASRGFVIERKQGEDGAFAPAGEAATGVTNAVLPGAPAAGQRWFYRVRAKTKEGYSAFSAEAVLTAASPR